MTRAFFGLLILLKIILYSKYESRHRRRHEGQMRACIRPSQSSSSHSSIDTVKSTFSEMTSEGHLRYLQPCSSILTAWCPVTGSRGSFELVET